MFNSVCSFKCFKESKNKPPHGLSWGGLPMILFKVIMPRKYIQYFNQPCKRWISLKVPKILLGYKHKGKGTKSFLLTLSQRIDTCSPFPTTNIKLITLMASLNVQGYLDASPHPLTSEKLDQDSSSPFLFPNPFLIFPDRKKSPPIPLWLDLDCIITLLKDKGHKICRNTGYSQTLQGLKADFFLDGIPLTAAQLLIRANRIRIEQGLEPFYVENVTEH